MPHFHVFAKVLALQMDPNFPWLAETKEWDFGAQATSDDEAGRIVASAVRDARDRDGKYCGGVLIELRVEPAGADWEALGWTDHHLQAADLPGIFYVSGESSRPQSPDSSSLAEHLPEWNRRREALAAQGEPPPTFCHPPMKWSEPTAVRYHCTACGAWRESPDASLLIMSLVTGYAPGSPQEQEVRAAKRSEGPFMRKHLEGCAGGAVVGVYPEDPDWDSLRPELREE